MELEKPESRHLLSAADSCHKLLLILDVFRDDPKINKKDFDFISKKILQKTGIQLSPAECMSLINKYWGLLYRPYGLCIFLAIGTGISLSLLNERYILSSVIAVTLIPLLFTFYTEIIISIHRFFLKEKTLIPAPCDDPRDLGTVAVVLVSRNEPFDVAKMTFDSAMAMAYPEGKKEIIVVDNSDTSLDDFVQWRDYVELYADGGALQTQEINVVFVHRDGVEGFKPRNLDIALGHVNSEYILYLDIDSTVLEDTLLRVVPVMRHDESLAFAQLQAVPTNFCASSRLTIANSIQSYKLRFDTIVLAYSSHTLFYGHNAIWRTSAVHEIGDSLEYYRDEVVVTEDLSMSLRALFSGLYGISVWLPSGEWVPESVQETEGMWLRWTVGTYQVYANYIRNVKQLKKIKTIEMIGWSQHFLQLINSGLVPVYVLGGLIFNSKILMSMVAIELVSQFLQLAGSMFKLSLGDMDFFKKLRSCYYGTFVLSSFINWIKFKGLYRFICRKKQGWKPTGKYTEEPVHILQVIKERWGFISYGLVCLVFCFYSLLNSTVGYLDTVLVTFCGLYAAHCLAAVFLFGIVKITENTHLDKTRVGVEEAVNFY